MVNEPDAKPFIWRAGIGAGKAISRADDVLRQEWHVAMPVNAIWAACASFSRLAERQARRWPASLAWRDASPSFSIRVGSAGDIATPAMAGRI